MLHWLINLCVERDSLKDKMVVYAFILLTVGLLAYAAFEPYLKPKIEVSLWSALCRDYLTKSILGNTGKEILFGCTIEWRKYLIYSLSSNIYHKISSFMIWTFRRHAKYQSDPPSYLYSFDEPPL